MKYNFNIAVINQCTETEGPFERLAIWFQGCDNHCAGCCNPELLALKPTNIISLENLITVIHNAKMEYQIEGVTFLGGEPVLQQGLHVLSERIQHIGLGIILFTGKKYEELPQKIVDNVDLIIDGVYENDNSDNERNLIGSKNQRLINITERYENNLDWFYLTRTSKSEINISEKLIMTGDVL